MTQLPRPEDPGAHRPGQARARAPAHRRVHGHAALPDLRRRGAPEGHDRAGRQRLRPRRDRLRVCQHQRRAPQPRGDVCADVHGAHEVVEGAAVHLRPGAGGGGASAVAAAVCGGMHERGVACLEQQGSCCMHACMQPSTKQPLPTLQIKPARSWAPSLAPSSTPASSPASTCCRRCSRAASRRAASGPRPT
jgi:hypothetical protein